MWHGWRARGARQSWIPDLPTVPDLEDHPTPVPGLYVATTTAGDWLDRVVVHGLGNRGRAGLVIAPGGVLLVREGESDVWIARESISDVRLDRGLAQKVFEAGGVIVITWALGSAVLDTGFRADDPDAHIAAAHQIAELVGVTGGAK